MREAVLESVTNCLKAIEQLRLPYAVSFIEKTAQTLADCFEQGGKVIVAGNGGSSCDAAHFAQELTGFFRAKRAALPAIALTEHGHITCTANDLGFEWIFSRGVEAYGKPGDVFVGLTTSGNSSNIINAIIAAKERGLATVAFLGKGGGRLKGIADIELVIEELNTSDRIQEAHMAAIHVIIEMVEHLLFSQEGGVPPNRSSRAGVVPVVS